MALQGRDVFGALGTVRPPPSHPRSMPREWGEVCKQIQLSEMKKKARLEANQEASGMWVLMLAMLLCNMLHSFP